MHKIRLPLGLRPRPEGAYGAPQTPLLYLRGRLLRGWWGKLLPYILLEEYTNILALEMASPRNLHCASCIGTLSFSIVHCPGHRAQKYLHTFTQILRDEGPSTSNSKNFKALFCFQELSRSRKNGYYFFKDFQGCVATLQI